MTAGRATASTGHPGRVLVTDAGRGSALAIIRSLGQKGWQVVAADADPHSPGFSSRWTTERLRYPSPSHDAGATVDRLVAAAAERRIDLLIPVTDDVLLPLAAARDRFGESTRLAIPDPLALSIVRDKAATLELAERLGVPIPRSALVRTAAEALERAGDFRLPIVVKPIASRVRGASGAMEPLTVAYAESPERLAAIVAGLEGRTAVLLQEFCPGEGQGVELLLDAGVPLAAFQHHRLREVPVTGGASAYRESVPLDPVLLDHSLRLLAELRWTGLAMVEFKVGPDGPRLMEINGRIWGSLPLAVRSGVDFPARLADLAMGRPGPAAVSLSSAPPYEVGVRMHNLDLEVVWILSVLRGRRRYPFLPMPPRRAALGAALDLFRPGAAFDVQSRSDPRPGLADVARIARKLVGKVGHGR